ncbi:MAG TPA: peptidoglycan-binding domain-containing protein [Bryobacteraceae bacterium]|nr:peptidoglycan-binding domain-containing protein [Bryobacteraceae bacterium]
MRGITIFAAALACSRLVAAQTTVPGSGGKSSTKSTVDAAKSPAAKASAGSTGKPGRKSATPLRTASASAKSGAKAKAPTSKLGARAAAAVGSSAGKSAAAKAPPRRAPQQQPTPDRYREIQQALADRGYFHGPADGDWGAESVDALKRFQADQSLDADGKIGALSLIALGLGPKRESAAARPASMLNPSPNPVSAPAPEPAPADPAAIAVPAPAPAPAP